MSAVKIISFFLPVHAAHACFRVLCSPRISYTIILFYIHRCSVYRRAPRLCTVSCPYFVVSRASTQYVVLYTSSSLRCLYSVGQSLQRSLRCLYTVRCSAFILRSLSRLYTFNSCSVVSRHCTWFVVSHKSISHAILRVIALVHSLLFLQCS